MQIDMHQARKIKVQSTWTQQQQQQQNDSVAFQFMFINPSERIAYLSGDMTFLIFIIFFAPCVSLSTPFPFFFLRVQFAYFTQ